MSSLFRNYFSLVKLLRKYVGNNRIKVRLFVQSAEVWPSLKSVWLALDEDSRVDTKIVSLPFLHDSTRSENPNEFFEAEGISYISWKEYCFRRDCPDVIFLQNPYDSTRPKKLSFKKLAKYGVKVAYVPYGLEVGGGDENLNWQYNLNVQQGAWRIFCRSERQRLMFRRYCDAGDRNVVVTGHPKLDLFWEQKELKLNSILRAKSEGRKVVLWNSHFSVGSPPVLWSTYQLYAEEIFHFFSNHPDMLLLFRPHPLFFQRMINEGLFSRSTEQEFRERLAGLPNVYLDESPSYLDAFFLSDALMTDAGSFIFEYLPTQKPIMYLENANGPGLSEEGEIVSSYYVGKNNADVRGYLEMILADHDPMHDERVSRTDEFLYKCDGRAGERIKDHIIQNVRSG